MPNTTCIFPRNLATLKFYFKILFDVVTFRGWLDFEGVVYRYQHTCTYTASIINLFRCHWTRVHTCTCIWLPTFYHVPRFQRCRDIHCQSGAAKVREIHGNIHVHWTLILVVAMDMIKIVDNVLYCCSVKFIVLWRSNFQTIRGIKWTFQQVITSGHKICQCSYHWPFISCHCGSM